MNGKKKKKKKKNIKSLGISISYSILFLEQCQGAMEIFAVFDFFILFWKKKKKFALKEEHFIQEQHFLA